MYRQMYVCQWPKVILAFCAKILVELIFSKFIVPSLEPYDNTFDMTNHDDTFLVHMVLFGLTP